MLVASKIIFVATTNTRIFGVTEILVGTGKILVSQEDLKYFCDKNSCCLNRLNPIDKILI